MDVEIDTLTFSAIAKTRPLSDDVDDALLSTRKGHQS
jgi:hypothetical protein